MPERHRFNPRYSPEFQRGYEPEAQNRAMTGQPDPAAGDGLLPGEREPAAADTPAPVTPAAPAVPAAPAAPAVAAMPVTPVLPPTPAGVGSPASAARHRSVWRNPYVIVLLVVGVLLAAVGLQLYYRSIDWMYAPPDHSLPTREDMVTLQVVWGLAPVLLSSGIFVLLGVGFFAASRWQRDRAREATGRRAAADETAR